MNHEEEIKQERGREIERKREGEEKERKKKKIFFEKMRMSRIMTKV